MASGICSPSGRAGAAGGTESSIRSDGLTRYSGSLIVRPPARTLPSRISRFSRVRLHSENFDARKRSSRPPASSAPTIASAMRSSPRVFVICNYPMNPSDGDDLSPAQARVVLRVRRLMFGSLLVMAAGFLAVFGVIAYRLYASAERARPPIEETLNLARGARVISTSAAGNRLVVTVENAGLVEVLIYDLETLQPKGRFVIKPTP